jgi:hypothetical protein
MQHNSTAEAPRLQTLSRTAFWHRHVNQWRESGLSKAAYCQQHSLVYHQMVYWCSKEDKVTDDTRGATNGFIAVSVTPATSARSVLNIRLPNGIEIEGIDELSVSFVGRLIEQL